MKIPALLPAALTLLTALTASGAETNQIFAPLQEEQTWPVSAYVISALYNFGPVFLIGGLMYWAAHRLGVADYFRRSSEHLKRSQECMQRQEQLLERIAQALENRNANRPQS